jgi:REP element-mobilizing transposase RayT
MRKQPLLNNEYYHIYNRGVDKRDIFSDKTDIRRFLESMKEFNRVEKIVSLSNLRKSNQIALKALSEESLVSIIAYCLNPNYFHFILKQSVDGGIAKFMQKLQAGYTSYFNIKNSRSGSLFQGTFKSQIISNENYFNKIIGYVNKNYQIHNIPERKIDLFFAGDHEYENNNFMFISKTEGEKILEIFGNEKKFKKHCDEIVSIIKEERGQASLLEDEKLPDSA